MFQFPGFALKTLCIQVLSTCLCTLLIPTVTIENIQVGCPIQKSMDQSLFSAPHGLSQSITSFIASCCQGIHQTPFSRLIRSRRRHSHVACRCGLVRPRSTLFWIRSHTFPARTFGSDNEQQSLLWLVYLTWTTLILFEEAYGRKAWRPSQPLAVPEGLALQRPGPLTCGGR